MMKNSTIGLLLFCLFFLIGCFKENGKKKYTLTLTFANGEQIVNEMVIFEKPKNYKESYNKTFYKDNKDIFVLRETGAQGPANNFIQTDILCYMTKEKKVIAENDADVYLHNSSYTGVSSAAMSGILKFNGTYKRFGRKITVDDGTFTFEWYNAEDVGKQDTTLTGTWSLKRE